MLWKPTAEEPCVMLHSRVGPMQFTRRTKINHDRGFTYETRVFDFTFENGFKAPVPVDVWQDLEHEYVDRKHNIQYKDAFEEL